MTTLRKNIVGQPPATSTDPVEGYPRIIRSATETAGETAIIERDADLYHRVTTRMANAGETFAAEDVLGPLDEADASSQADNADRG